MALGALCARAAHADSLRLSEVLTLVEERGPEQAVATGQLDIARADVHTARMFPNPGILLSAGRAEPVFAGSLQFRLPIFGQRGARVAAEERALDQTAREVAWTRWRLRHDARIAYYSVARADDEVAIASEVETLSRRIADIAREKYEVGSGTRLDQLQAALVDVRAQQDVSDRRAIARVARLELARQLGATVESLGALTDLLGATGATPSLASLLADARGQHPELRAILAEREAARARAHAARADRRPVPTLELGVELLDPSTCGGNNFCVGPRGAIGFDLPVLNLNGGPIDRALAETRLADLKAGAAQVRIESAIRAAYESWTAAVVRARFFDSQYVPNAIAVEAMAREGFSAGRSGLLPLIEAQRAVLDARLGRTEALYAVQAARADLEVASGVPLSAP